MSKQELIETVGAGGYGWIAADQMHGRIKPRRPTDSDDGASHRLPRYRVVDNARRINRQTLFKRCRAGKEGQSLQCAIRCHSPSRIVGINNT